MKIPNYDIQDDVDSNYKQLFDFMSDQVPQDRQMFC